MQITTNHELSRHFISDIFETAQYSAIDYWCEYSAIHRSDTDPTIITQMNVREEDEPDIIRISHDMVGKAIQSLIDGTVQVNSLTRSDILRAVLEDDTGYIDADAADVIIQVAALGEIRYG